MLTTASAVQQEHADTNLLDPKDLTQQKGNVKPQYSGSSSDQDVSVMFQPCKFGAFQLPHRMVYAPLTRCRAIDSSPQKNMIEYYRQRAIGSEGGLVILSFLTQAMGIYMSLAFTPKRISRAGRILLKLPKTQGQSSFVSCDTLAGRLIQLAWTHNPIQPSCASLEGTSCAFADYQPNKAPPLSSVAVAAEGDCITADGPKPQSTPQALDTAGIARITEEFRQAARNAMDAGFDGIEIHGANGYIIDQFLKPKPNNCTDEYGGSIEKRCRFCLEVVKAVTNEIGSEKALGVVHPEPSVVPLQGSPGGRTRGDVWLVDPDLSHVEAVVGLIALCVGRLSPYSEFGDVADDQPNATNRYLTKQLNNFGLAYLHMVEPRMAGNFEVEVSDSTYDLGHFRKLYNGTFIAAGGYNRERAISSLQKDHADLICFGRHYLSNPDLPRRFREHAELNAYNRDTFYSHDDQGYIDYPFLEEGNVNT